jgi:hypothetical protein
MVRLQPAMIGDPRRSNETRVADGLKGAEDRRTLGSDCANSRRSCPTPSSFSTMSINPTAM